MLYTLPDCTAIPVDATVENVVKSISDVQASGMFCTIVKKSDRRWDCECFELAEPMSSFSLEVFPGFVRVYSGGWKEYPRPPEVIATHKRLVEFVSETVKPE